MGDETMSELGIESISIDDFASENWEMFSEFKEVADKNLTKISREIPPELYLFMQEKLLEIYTSIGLKTDFKMKLIIDSNIIINDAFRVGNGKKSTTERILSSPFISVMAPPNIKEEVEKNIFLDLPKGCSLNIALKQAQKLLSKIDLITEISYKSINKARLIIGEHSPEDIPFLALAFESDVNTIISRDKKAFDSVPEIKRWELKDTVNIVVTFESGTLSFFLIAASSEILINAFEKVILLFFKAFVEIMNIIIAFLIGFITGSYILLKKIPDWAWVILIGVGIGIILAMILSEDFRNMVINGFSELWDFFKKLVKKIIEVGKIIWQALKIILIWIWNLILPVVIGSILVAGVLGNRIHHLFMEYNTAMTENN